MCAEKDKAKTKIEQLLEAMDRLTVALQAIDGRLNTLNEQLQKPTASSEVVQA